MFCAVMNLHGLLLSAYISMHPFRRIVKRAEAEAEAGQLPVVLG